MADDGKGESVNIPTFLISSSDGNTLKDVIHSTEDDAKQEEAKGQRPNW